MKRTIYIVLCTALLSILAIHAPSVCALEPEAEGYLLKLAEDAPLPLAAEESLTRVLPSVYRTEDGALAEALLEYGLAEYVEPDWKVTLFEEPTTEALSWNAALMRTDSATRLELDGTGVRIAIIDSGLDAANRNLAGAQIAEGWDYLENDSVLRDDLGHGTRVAQVIAGAGVNGAVTGVASGAELISLRCFGAEQTARVSQLAQAVRDAVDTFDCDLLNLSWGLKSDSQTLHDAIRYAYDAGVVIVAAGGNVSSAYPQGTTIYPAAYEEVIGVGAVDSAGTVSDTSQQTAAICVCAPGKELPFLTTAGTVSQSSGTSFAAPAVAGAAALVRQTLSQLDGAGVLALLRERTEDLGKPGYDTAYGYGLVRLDRLFGASWRYFTVSGTAAGWLLREGGGIVAAAVYGADGQMDTARLWQSGKTLTPFWYGVPGESTVRVLFLTPELMPLDSGGAA